MSNSSTDTAPTHRFAWWLLWYVAAGVLFYGAGLQIVEINTTKPVTVGLIVFILYGICVPTIIVGLSPQHVSKEMDVFAGKFIFGCFVGGCAALATGVMHGILGG